MIIDVFHLRHCMYRCTAVFEERVEPSVAGALRFRRAIIMMIISS